MIVANFRRECPYCNKPIIIKAAIDFSPLITKLVCDFCGRTNGLHWKWCKIIRIETK